MKQIIPIIIIAVIGFFGYQYFQQEVVAYDVTEIIEKKSAPGDDVLVTGVVSKNFNILGKGGYELQDRRTGESIYVCKDGVSPQMGEVLTIRVKKIDVITFNDKKLSFYSELNE